MLHLDELCGHRSGHQLRKLFSFTLTIHISITALVAITLSAGAGDLLAQKLGPLSAGRRKASHKTSTSVISQPEKIITVAGELMEINITTLLIQPEEGNKLHIVLDPRTRFVLSNRIITVETLIVGDKVTIHGFKENFDEMRAIQVSVHPNSLNKISQSPMAVTWPEVAQNPPAEDDDGALPVLRRRKPAKNQQNKQKTREKNISSLETDRLNVHKHESENFPNTSTLDDTMAQMPTVVNHSNITGRPRIDPLIVRTREWVFSYSTHLPNFVCRQVMTRTEKQGFRRDWHTRDVIEADVVYEDQKEDYRNIEINGRPSKHGMHKLEGSWSMGEFASALLSVFSASSQTQFQFSHSSNIAGLRAKVYQFSVGEQSSHWQVASETKTITPAYEGSIWINEDTAQVIRIEKNAVNIPKYFELNAIEMTVDYDRIRISGTEYFLPVRSENLGCWRGTGRCARNTIQFRNYRKFGAESTIITTDSSTDSSEDAHAGE